MRIMKKYLYILTAVSLLISCTRENEDLVEPVLFGNYPQVILFDDEGGGELEDSDEFSLLITLADRFDPSGEALGGQIVPLDEALTLDFSLQDLQGFNSLESYLLGAEAFYEIDDCTTSLDEGNDLLISFDPASGQGQLTFPAGIEEVELVFTVDEDYFSDETLNEERGFSISLSAAETENEQVLDVPFVYEVLDDEAIFGEWTLDANNPDQFQAFQRLFGLLNPEISALTAASVEEVVWEFAYDELKVEIVLKETEEVTECGETETENLVIEIEAGYEELSRRSLSGEIEVEESIEQEDGSEIDFVYAGSFEISGESLQITLTGEYDDESTEEITLTLEK
jgi:hypothetical protein